MQLFDRSFEMSTRPLLVERLESPATQQSQEQYLLPRNCWFRMTSIHLRPTNFEKSVKIRIKISVPNSARVIRTSWIVIDDQQAAILQAAQPIPKGN